MPKIMIVDDDITSLSMARAILESEYTTIPVRSGYEALRLLAAGAEPPDLILLDINMPVVSGYEVLEIQRPCLLTAVKELNRPRYMTIIGIERAYEKEITVWDENDLGIRPEDCGHHASPTKVFRSFTPPPKGKGEMLSGTVNEMAQTLVSRLMEKHIL